MSSYQKGMDAYDRGGYDTALKEFRPLAEQGYPLAQATLGLMYAEGEGVAQDYQEAVRWYRLAAEQGDAWALLSLGGMYDQGEGGSQNYVLAYMWFTLAARHGSESAIRALKFYETKLTPAQLAEAQRLARVWEPKGH